MITKIKSLSIGGRSSKQSQEGKVALKTYRWRSYASSRNWTSSRIAHTDLWNPSSGWWRCSVVKGWSKRGILERDGEHACMPRL